MARPTVVSAASTAAALLLISPAQAQDCRLPQWVLNEADEYVANFAVADALGALAQLESSHACSDVADPTVLAKLWLARGLAQTYAGRGA